VAFISLFLSFLAKKVGSIIQAIFGWSVTALFGRLPGKKQLAVSIALVVSIAWPIFVLGLFSPRVAGWVLAFIPFDAWASTTFLRIAWGALAFLAPLLVGGLVHWAAPSTKGGLGRSLLNGYPLALGFLVAFLLTVVTVPLVKLASIFRGWSDEHVYVQARAGRYDSVLRELAEACARAGLLPEITDVPTRMELSTRALKFFARGTVSPIVAERVKCVRAGELELYLYPSDLLVRGKPEQVALVRAMLTRTEIDADAYLVASPAGQSIQDELGRLINVIQKHERRNDDIGQAAESRLVEIWKEMTESKLPFDEWVMLESIARRVERRLAQGGSRGGALALDSVEDQLTRIARQANAGPSSARHEQEKRMVIEVPASERSPAMLEEASTAELVKEAMDEGRELIRLEVALAKEEVKAELKQVQHAAISMGVAAACALMVLCLLSVALVLALGGTAVVALLVALAFLVVGGLAAFLGYGMLPKRPMEKTRHRFENDVNQLKEHIA
jgi:hypothetical protein